MTLSPSQAAPARSIRSRIIGRGRDHAATERAVLVLHDVTKQYPNGNVALRDVDLVIPEGDFVFLVGPSGAGKSTLIKLLIRDELATRGAVVLDGQDVARLGRRQVPKMRRKIGIIFQDFKLLPNKNVWENVAFALEVTGTPRRKIRPAVDRVLALVGPSGAGKSTIIKLLIRDEIATQGQVVLDGHDLAKLPRRAVPKVRRKIGIVFQDFKLLPTKSVWENVAFALEVTGTRRRDIRPAVDRVLSLVGLSAQARQLPAQLSGGEQQRTAIARALVHDPRVIIADEPTGNLDPLISWEIIQLLQRINELGVTILMATHNAEVVTALRKRVVALEEGRVTRDELAATYHRED